MPVFIDSQPGPCNAPRERIAIGFALELDLDVPGRHRLEMLDQCVLCLLRAHPRRNAEVDPSPRLGLDGGRGADDTDSGRQSGRRRASARAARSAVLPPRRPAPTRRGFLGDTGLGAHRARRSLVRTRSRADCKGNIASQLTALRALGDDLPVSIKIVGKGWRSRAPVVNRRPTPSPRWPPAGQSSPNTSRSLAS